MHWVRRCGAVYLLFLSISAFALQATPPAPAPTKPGEQQTEAKPDAKPQEPAKFTLSPEKYQKAIAFSRAKYRLHFIDIVYGVVILLAVLALGIAPRIRDIAERTARRRFLQACIFVPLFSLVTDVCGLPTAIYGQWLSLKYEQSIQSWPSWFWDWAKGELIGFIISIVLIWILYGVMRRSPRRWWFYFWLAAIPIVILLQLVTPVIIEPLFYKFTLLADKQPHLVHSIAQVVNRGGLEIPESRMFEMDASTKMKAVNAYVTGLGASKRVVVWDTTIANMTEPEILFVFGHEMGHYVLNHIYKGMAFGLSVILLLLYLAYHAMQWAIARWGGAWQVRGVDDWASLPVLALAFALFGFVSEPIFNAHIRHQEHQADIYGLEVVHGLVPDSPRVAASAFQKLGEISLSDPDPSPLTEFWLYSHPSVGARVRFAAEYDPWSKGEATRFVK